ncbi:hypothetical protein [Azotosporobacter soli]|uniref:hypothetical protein n=1 Tax=Azotosporobacter soli TaxID=3055040 RepID=UPI0031FF0CD8
MEAMLVLPVANGILPRPGGGIIAGVFLPEQGGDALFQVGAKNEVLLCPWQAEEESLYPVGVSARIREISQEQAVAEDGTPLVVYLATLEGCEHVRWHSLREEDGYFFAGQLKRMNFRQSRKTYPVISGAGWLPQGGYTEFRSEADLPVTIYGTDLESEREVSVSANLGGLVSKEQAHTIEHAIIRALSGYGLCTAKTLLMSVIRETTELKQSVENSIRFTLPEIIGHTDSGICGNPMTNLARFYLARDFTDNLRGGKGMARSLSEARRKTMSELTGEIGLSLAPGLRVMQGLKKGMSHDDTVLQLKTYQQVIARFPFDPWG